MATIEDFVLRFKTVGTEKINQAGSAISGLRNDVASFAQVGGPLGNTLNGIITKLGPIGLAAGVAGTAFALLGGKALQLAAQLEDVSGATGLSTGVINSFTNSVIEAGGKAEDAATLLFKLRQNVEDAAAGSETAQKAFKNLGVFITDASGAVRPMDDILQDLVKRLNSGEISSTQFAGAIDALGKGIGRLDLKVLDAADNPAVTEATKNIDKYNQQIDKLTNSIRNELILSFGEFAKALNEGGFGAGIAKTIESLGSLAAEVLNFPTDVVAYIMNLFGANINPVGLGDPLKKVVERAAKDRERYQAEMVKFKKAQEDGLKPPKTPPLSTTPLGPTGGGFGATSETAIKAAQANAKAVAEATSAYTKRITEINADIERQTQLKLNTERLSLALVSANEQKAIEEKSIADIAAININTAAEIEKAKTNIFAQERLTRSQKENEFIVKESELKLKAEADIARIRQASAEAFTRETERIEEIIRTSKARIEEEEAVNDILNRRNQFINNNVTATDLQQSQAQNLFDIEEDRLEVLRRIRQIQDLPEAARAQREREINAIYDERLELTRKQNIQDIKNSRDFETGMIRAFNTFAEEATNASRQAERIFQQVTQSMEDMMVDFAKTGKFEFNGFLNSIVEDLLRSQIRQLMAQVLGIGNFANSTAGVIGSASRLLGFANGGIIPTNGPVIVGERGPEILSGAAGRVVTPNNQLTSGTNVTYNINAVDAVSFKQLVARDPGFIYAVTQQGAKGIPSTRR